MRKTLALLVALTSIAGAATAATPAELQKAYAAEARQADAGFAPSASRGEALFRQKNGDKSCSGCHTEDPRKEGRTRAMKTIAPLAPAANPERLTEMATTEKWFGRNCRDVLGRACTPAEKADFVTWLISIR